jgi:hypothetical protein
MTVDNTDSTVKDARILIYGTEGDEKRFLLIREFNGNYTLPGGYKNIEDENLQITAARILSESLCLPERSYSLKNTDIEIEDPGIYTDPVSGRKKDIGIYLFVARYNGMEDIKLSADFQRIIWLKELDAHRLLTQEHIQLLFMHGVSYC